MNRSEYFCVTKEKSSLSHHIIMKRKFIIFATTLAFSLISLVPATAYAREKSVGLRGGYTTRNETGIAGLYFQYRFIDKFRLAANIDYAFSHKNVDAYLFNIDGHVPFNIAPRFELYPLAGFTFATFNHHNSDDSSSRTNRFGANVGAGAAFRVTPSLRLGFEAKYQYVKHFSAGVFAVSIGYIF